LLAYGKIDLNVPPETQPKAMVEWPPETEPKEIVGRSPDWQRLEALLWMQSYASLKERVEKAVLLTVGRLREQLAGPAGLDATESQALAELFALETVLLSRQTVERDSLLRRVRDDKERLLAQFLQRLDALSGPGQWLALVEALNCVPAADRAVQQRLWEKLTQRIEQFNASPKSVRESVRDLAELEILSWTRTVPTQLSGSCPRQS